MDLSDIERITCDVASRELGIPRERVTPASRLLADLHCDSLDFVELLMELEEEFSIKLPTSTPDPIFKTVFTRHELTLGDLAEAIYLRQGVIWEADASRRRAYEPELGSPADELATFTQLGARWQPGLATQATAIHEPLERNSEAVGSLHVGDGRAGVGGLPLFRRRSDGMRCMLVPAAVVEVGSEAIDAEPDERPVHLVSLDAFLLDAEPVSVTAYCRFLNSIAPSEENLRAWVLLAPEDDRGIHLQVRRGRDGQWTAASGTEYQPIVLVSWYGANAYSRWAHGSDWRDDGGEAMFLPSEAQWEYAARGSSRAVVDGGEELDAIRRHESSAIFGRHVRGERYGNGILPLSPVNARRGMSPWGMHHMSGNIWHWCRDWYDEGYYGRPDATARNPVNGRATGTRSERGGSWVGPAYLTRVSHRRGRAPDARGRCLGFRCSASASMMLQ